MKKIAKTVAALALTFTATACDPSQVLNGAGPVPCNPNQGDHYTAASTDRDAHNSGAALNLSGAVPCNPNQGDHYTAAAGQDGHNSGAVLNSGGPIVDPDHNDKF